jgi:hypothetical protein
LYHKQLIHGLETCFEIGLYLLLWEWWQPTSFIGKMIKLPLKWAGAFVAFPGTLTVTAMVYAWWTGAITL